MNQQQRPDYDELAYQLVLNESNKSNSLDCATFFLNESASRVRLNAGLPQSSPIIGIHALIAHNELMHVLDRDRLSEVIKSIDSLNDSVKDLSDVITAVSSDAGTYNKSLIERLDNITESIDCAGAKTPDFWMSSDLAAIDKAKEIGLTIQQEWSTADLRYKLHQAIYGGEHG